MVVVGQLGGTVRKGEGAKMCIDFKPVTHIVDLSGCEFTLTIAGKYEYILRMQVPHPPHSPLHHPPPLFDLMVVWSGHWNASSTPLFIHSIELWRLLPDTSWMHPCE